MFDDIDETETLRSVVGLGGFGCISLEYNEGKDFFSMTVDDHNHGIVTVELGVRDLFSLMGKLMEAQGWLI
jgi:hypothetical protein